MKIKYTLAAMAATTLAANATTVVTSYGTVTGPDDSNQAGPMWGQTITPDVGASPAGPHPTLYLTNFQYQAHGGGAGGGGVTVYLHAYDSFTANGGTVTSIGNLVAVSTTTLDLSAVGGHGNMSWDFSGAEAFIAANQYTFVMSTNQTAATTVDFSNLVGGDFDLNTGDPYSGGQAHRANGVGTDWDMEFQATFETSPVPEPSSSALLGLGGLALILRRRK